jgi:hypothetical protein
MHTRPQVRTYYDDASSNSNPTEDIVPPGWSLHHTITQDSSKSNISRPN